MKMVKLIDDVITMPLPKNITDMICLFLEYKKEIPFDWTNTVRLFVLHYCIIILTGLTQFGYIVLHDDQN